MCFFFALRCIATTGTARRAAPTTPPAPDPTPELRAELAKYAVLLREVASNTAATQTKMADIAYLVKDAQNEIQKLQPTSSKVKDLVQADLRVRDTLANQVKPILDAFKGFMDDTRTRLDKLENDRTHAEAYPEKRRRIDSPPPALAMALGPTVATAPAPFMFNTTTTQPPAPTGAGAFMFAPTLTGGPSARNQVARARTNHYIKFGPIDTNGCAPLYVIQQMVQSLTNGALFTKLIKQASLFPGTNDYILATLYSHDHAAGVTHAWNTTRSAAHASITAELAGQSQGN